MLPYDDQLTLPLLYHLNSEPWMNMDAYSDPSARMEFKSVGEAGGATLLPAPSASPVIEAAEKRQSCRQFSGARIALTELSDLLHAAYGITGSRTWDNGRRSFRRAVPSAGGLYPLEVYVVCDHVDSVAPGVYHFHARHRALEAYLSGLRIADLTPVLMRQSWAEGAGALILLAAVFQRTLKKYGPRGYRYVLFEAGHVAQNICLRASEMRLATLCLGGFNDAQLNAALGLDGMFEAVLYGVAVGRPR
jgi:SagB-type dehydrogenase family enzyme